MARIDHEFARKHGVSKAMRQYAKRYGAGVEMMRANQLKYGEGWKRGDWRVGESDSEAYSAWLSAQGL